MEVRTAMENRASVTRFMAEPIPEEHLREMVRLAGTAPSVNNAQPWRYIAVVQASLRQRMVEAVHRKLDVVLPELRGHMAQDAREVLREYCTSFGRAPCVFAVATRRYEALLDRVLAKASLVQEEADALRGYPDVISLGASLQNLMLAATDLGYGSCWLTGPLVAREETEELLDVRLPWRLGALVAVGRAIEPVCQSPKRGVDEILELRR